MHRVIIVLIILIVAIAIIPKKSGFTSGIQLHDPQDLPDGSSAAAFEGFGPEPREILAEDYGYQTIRGSNSLQVEPGLSKFTKIPGTPYTVQTPTILGTLTTPIPEEKIADIMSVQKKTNAHPVNMIYKY